MRVDISSADAGIVLETQPDARLACNLAHQTRIGFDFADIGRIGSLDAADIGIVRIVIDVDDRREVKTYAECPQLVEAGGEDRSFLSQWKQIEFLCARQRYEASRILEPPHQAAFLIDEDQRRGWQPGNLGT